MNKLFAVAVCVLAVAATLDAAATKYTTKYDNVDVDEVLGNDRLLNQYFKCLMEQAKCTADGEELKKVLPDAIKTKCSSCSDKQKEGANKIVKFLYEKKSDMWKALEDKYDPTHVYRTQYKEDAKKYGIEV